MRLAHVSLLGTLIGAGFWGLSGTAAQAVFQTYQFPVIALVTIRTLVSGMIPRPYGATGISYWEAEARGIV